MPLTPTETEDRGLSGPREETPLPKPNAPTPPVDDGYFRVPALATYQLSPAGVIGVREFQDDLKNDTELAAVLSALLVALPAIPVLTGGGSPEAAYEVANMDWELIARIVSGLPDLLRKKYRDRCISEQVSTTKGYTADDKRFWQHTCNTFERRPRPPAPPSLPTKREPIGDPTGAGGHGRIPMSSQPTSGGVVPSPSQAPSPAPAPSPSLGGDWRSPA